jgi:SAM-dependent methyltransferase
LSGGDVRTLPFANETFAAYVSLGVLEHFEDIAQRDGALSEAWRVLRPDGLALVAVPHCHLICRLRGEQSGDEGLFYQYLLTPDEVREMLIGAGFEVLGTYFSNQIQWILDSRLGKHLLHVLRGTRSRQSRVDELSGTLNGSGLQESILKRFLKAVAKGVDCLLPGNVFGHTVMVIATRPAARC